MGNNANYPYSNIESVSAGNSIDIVTLYPNPVVDKFRYLLHSSMDTEIDVTVTNLLGQPVIREHSLVTKGVTEMSLAIETLSNGNYIIQVITETGLYRAQKDFVVTGNN